MPYCDYNGNYREYRHEKEERKIRENEARRLRHLEHGRKFNSMPLKEWCLREREICYKRDLKYWVREALRHFNTLPPNWSIPYTLSACDRFHRTWINRGLKNAFGGENGPARLIAYMEGDREKMDPVFRTLCMIKLALINEALIKDEKKRQI